MLVAQGDQIALAHQRFAAGIDVYVHAQRLALLDDAIQRGKVHVQFVAIFRGPAARAVQIAGGSGGHQNGPGNVAAVFFPRAGLLRTAQQRGVQNQVFKQRLAHARIDIRPEAANQPVPVVVRIVHHFVEYPALAGEGIVPVELIHPVQQLGNVRVRIFVQIVVCLAQTHAFDFFRDTHLYRSFPANGAIIKQEPFLRHIQMARSVQKLYSLADLVKKLTNPP